MPQPDPLTTHQRQIVNKQLTLNLLIQGAATHGHWTAHRLVDRQLNEIDPQLFQAYDEMMVRSRLCYWLGGIPSVMGNPTKFWWKIRQDGHEFGFHPFLVKHGFRIALETERDVIRRCRLAGISVDVISNESRAFWVYQSTIDQEVSHIASLEKLAKDVCCDMYGIERHLLEASLTQTPRFGTIREPSTWAGQEILATMVGWSGVVRRNGKLNVKASATFWPLLVHELIKGSVELICLHGTNRHSEADWEVALERCDHVEYEIPMLQIGGTIFQRFLLARPREIMLAESIMHVAKLEPLMLERFMFHLFESPNQATSMIRNAAAASRGK